MTLGRILILVAVIFFGVDFVLVLSDSSNVKIIQELLYLGLASFAAGHL